MADGGTVRKYVIFYGLNNSVLCWGGGGACFPRLSSVKVGDFKLVVVT